MAEIITSSTSADFEAAKREEEAKRMCEKLNSPEANQNTINEAKKLVWKQITEELKTIKEEQFEITKRKAEEFKASGLNTKSDFMPRASIHPRAYARWERAYPGCWEDKQFFEEYLRDNPEADLRAYMKLIMPSINKYFVV